MCMILHSGEVCSVRGIFFPSHSHVTSILLINQASISLHPLMHEGAQGIFTLSSDHIQNARLFAGIVLMSPFNRQYFFDFYDIFISFDNIKYRKGFTDMKTLDHRRVEIVQFFLISIRKRILYQAQDFVHDNAPGFFGQHF